MKTRRIKTVDGVLALSILVIISIVLVGVSPETAGILQAASFIVGMALLWYTSHALGHYLFARLYGVQTLYFYVGRSEMRKANIPFSKSLKYLVTIGTKLDREKFKVLPSKRRAAIMGAGALVSTILSALVVIFALAEHLGTLSVALGSVFFLANFATEVALGTKVGDLKKMNTELRA